MNGFWFYMLIMMLLTPLTMIFFGCLFYYKPPKNINSVYGYRTKRSMKNSKTWEFAHHYCGRIWMLMGIGMLLVSVVYMKTVMDADVDTIGNWSGILIMIQCVIMILAIPLTERALRKNFDDYGMKKEE